MPMRVDQTRHHNPSAAIDHLRAFRRGQIAGCDRLDAITLDKEAEPAAQGFGGSVEKQKIPEHDRWRGAGRRRLRAGRPNKPERGQRRKRRAHAGDETASRQFAANSTRGELKLRQAAGTGGRVGRVDVIGGWPSTFCGHDGPPRKLDRYPTRPSRYPAWWSNAKMSPRPSEVRGSTPGRGVLPFRFAAATCGGPRLRGPYRRWLPR